MQNSVDKLVDISNRLEQIENSAEWISREILHSDTAISQTGSLICVLADDIRKKVCALVKELEETISLTLN